MTFGKKTLFSILLGVDLLANVLEVTQVNFLLVSTLLSFFTCILLPGFLISLILRIRMISFWENLLISIGLSLAFLEFGGLLLNILLPSFGINNPLAFQNLVTGFDVFTLLLFILAWIRAGQLVVHIQLPRRSKFEKALYALPLLFPALAAFGAISLNNGGSNILTLILLGAIACYALLLVLFRDKITVDLYPYALFFVGLACLLTTSLRSWFITGHDIEREFYVFQLTNAHHIWNMAFFQDAYNACLSITILPTILTNLLSIQDIYVYKVIFQILFATSPVLVFFIVRKYTVPVFAFLAAFIFMSFPTFFNDMPMLNRQEIGFIFFGLVLYMMLHAELTISMRKLLFIIFGIAVIVSHYSTNFILLSLITFVYILTWVISLSFVKNIFAFLLARSRIKIKNTFNNNAFLTLPLLLLLFLMTYFWNSFYTNTSNHVGSVFTEVVSGIFVRSNAETKSNDVSYSLFSSSKLDPNQQLQAYIQSIIASEGNSNAGQFYSKATISRYRSYAVPPEQLVPTALGNLLTNLHIPVFTIQSELRSFSADFMQIFVFIGWLAFFFFKGLKEKLEKIIPPRLSLKMRRGLIQRSSFYRHSSLQPGTAFGFTESRQSSLQPEPTFGFSERMQLQDKTRGMLVSPRLSLKPSGRLIQRPFLPGQAILQFHRPGQHLPYSIESNTFNDPQFGKDSGSPNKKSFDVQFLLLCLGSIFLLVLITVLPALSVEYGILRMFQQLLFMLSLPIVLGVCFIFSFVKEQKRVLITGIIAIIFFLNLTGFISHLTGDYYPQMTLDNAGIYYDAYYVHKANVVAIVWLSKTDLANDPVEADASGINKLLPYGDIFALNEIFPPIIRKNAYVYLEVSSNVVVSVDNDVEIFNSPEPFLNDNKNLIYSNGTVNIYK